MLLIHYCQIILLSPDASHFINENGEFPDLSTSTLRLYITKSKHFCAAHFAAPLPLNTTCIWREACLVLEPWQDAPISFTSSVQLAVGKRNQKRRFAAACWRMPMLMSNCSDSTSPQKPPQVNVMANPKVARVVLDTKSPNCLFIRRT